MEKVLIEFIDDGVKETLKEFQKVFKIDNIYYSESLSSEHEISLLFNKNSLVYCEDDDAYIFFYNTNQEIYFFLERGVFPDSSYMQYFLEDFINEFKFSFLHEDDQILFRFLKGNRLNLQWRFNLNNILIEEDSITSEAFSKFSHNIFDILHIISTLITEFARKNSLSAYEYREDIDFNNKKRRQFYHLEKIRDSRSTYLNSFLEDVNRYTDRQLIIEKNQRNKFLLSLPFIE